VHYGKCQKVAQEKDRQTQTSQEKKTRSMEAPSKEIGARYIDIYIPRLYLDT
jgi:hypothetical protein